MDLCSSNQSEANEPSRPLDNRPLWNHVTRLPKTSEGGGNVPFRCNFCNVQFQGSYSRVKSHLLKIGGNGIRPCKKVTDIQFMELTKLEKEATERRERTQLRIVPLQHAFSSSGESSSRCEAIDALDSMRQERHELRKRKVGDDTPTDRAFSIEAKEKLDLEIAMMFYSGGLPFNLAKNPHYIKAFSLVGYSPPDYNALRTTLLAKVRKSVESSLEFTKSLWRSFGVTLVCSGWTDPQRRPAINFMAVGKVGTVFIRAINCEEGYKDKYFISRLIKEVIVEVGIDNVVQVITDNDPVCRAAGMLVEEAYPKIFWTPCVVHTLNLALKNICAAKSTDANEITYDECRWIAEIASSALMIKTFLSNHPIRLNLFNKFPKLKLLMVAETRFASVIVMLKRFKVMKQELLAMVNSDEWSCYQHNDIAKARLVKEKLLDNSWWDSIDYILDFTDPIYKMIRECDSDKSCLHLVPEMWDSMMSQVRETIYKHEKKSDSDDSSFWNVVCEVLEDRWNKSNNPLYCLAYTLNPRYSSKEYQAQYPNLVPPQSDLEISNITKLCMKRLISDKDAQRANAELANFLGCLEHFADEDSMRDRLRMNPMSWWIIYGAAAYHLQGLAIRFLTHVSSSSCSERNWSTYSFMHSIKKNQITTQHAEDLVYIHNNLRLLSRKNPQYIEGETRMWDMAGDAFESSDDVGILEIANLSLDEPELEHDLLVDEFGEEALKDSSNLKA